MAEEKKSKGNALGAPEVDVVKTLQGRIDVLQKENGKLKTDVAEAEKRFVDLRKGYDRNQEKAAKKTQWNPWTLIYASKDNKDRTEVINVGSRGVIIHRVVNGIGTCVFAERVRYKCVENSDGSFVNMFF